MKKKKEKKPYLFHLNFSLKRITNIYVQSLLFAIKGNNYFFFFSSYFRYTKCTCLIGIDNEQRRLYEKMGTKEKVRTNKKKHKDSAFFSLVRL
jgi:hypothetical protein